MRKDLYSTEQKCWPEYTITAGNKIYTGIRKMKTFVYISWNTMAIVLLALCIIYELSKISSAYLV